METDIVVGIEGGTLSVIDGWRVASAVARTMGVALHDLPAAFVGEGHELRIRTVAELVPALSYGLDGLDLQVEDNNRPSRRLRLLRPRVVPLMPRATLVADLVTIRGKRTAEGLAERCRQVLMNRGLTHAAQSVEIGDRRVLRVREALVLGWAMRVSGLPWDESLALQRVGLGGRRRFGGGVFVC